MTEEMAMQYQRGYIDGFKEGKAMATVESFKGMNTYIIGEADRIHVKGEYYEGKKLLRCSNCGTRGISTFDMHCSGCGFLLDRIDDIDGAMRISHTPQIIEVDELPNFTNHMEVTYVEKGAIRNEHRISSRCIV